MLENLTFYIRKISKLVLILHTSRIYIPDGLKTKAWKVNQTKKARTLKLAKRFRTEHLFDLDIKVFIKLCTESMKHEGKG